MIFYLTFNDSPSGIYRSQVIDVIKFIRNELNQKIKLIAFISIRNFSVNKNKIKAELSDSIVLPMFPGIVNWKKNKSLLNYFIRKYKPNIIIGRSVIATNLALRSQNLRHKYHVIYDGRGAITEEWKEYKVVVQPEMLAEIYELEKNAILKSKFRIAVSKKLIQHWSKTYNYSSKEHLVIPCTIEAQYENLLIDSKNIESLRKELNFLETDIVFIYAGSSAGWQSLSNLKEIILKLSQENPNAKFLFLCPDHEIIHELKKNQVKIQHYFVEPNHVYKYLLAADYGLLIRGNSITNSVASPVKFAEYLSCGLQVIISPNLGDYSDFVVQHNCGFIYKPNQKMDFKRTNKQISNKLAHQYFTKKSFHSEYKKLTEIELN
ncbi:MAG: hypothetical protein IPM51_02645 [Sphingobacteriaceae bacterium]|nr:hypothetical protein [Sphingobacteriaceae bacterium]